jgi:hypothetical protein
LHRSCSIVLYSAAAVIRPAWRPPCALQLAQLVAENIFNIDDVKFWMRIATRSDSASSQADKVGAFSWSRRRQAAETLVDALLICCDKTGRARYLPCGMLLAHMHQQLQTCPPGRRTSWLLWQKPSWRWCSP